MAGAAANEAVTAAALNIGDEILSGRTHTNLRHIALCLGVHGVDLMEARTVADIHEEIIATLDALRTRYDYVITTGALAPPTTTSPPTLWPPLLALSFMSIPTSSP